MDGSLDVIDGLGRVPKDIENLIVHQATLMIGGERPVAIPLRGVGLLDSPDEVIWPSI